MSELYWTVGVGMIVCGGSKECRRLAGEMISITFDGQRSFEAENLLGQ
jgi:hypothetical protein